MQEDRELELNNLLETGLSVLIKIQTGSQELEIPDYLKNRAYLVLEVGYNLALPIPDINIDQDGVSCTLSFNKKPFCVFLPWESIVGYGGEAVEEYLKHYDKNKEQKSNTKNKKQSSYPTDTDGKIVRPPWLKVVK